VNAKTSGGDIIVKNNQAKVTAHTSGGDIELSNIGAEVEAHTSGGDIEVYGSKGNIDVITSGGDITLKDINDRVSAKTSGGDIEATRVRKGIKVKTSGGDIELDDIQGFIEAKTSGGDIEAKMTLKDFSRDHHVMMNSSGGNLTLAIPAKLPATIVATIHLQGRSWRDYDIASDFPLTSSKQDEQKGRGRQRKAIVSKGKINGGGDLIQLETTNGNITIKKLR